jgi:hypothetical protein
MGNHFIQAIIKERRIEPFECDISQPELTRDFFNSVKNTKIKKLKDSEVDSRKSAIDIFISPRAPIGKSKN